MKYLIFSILVNDSKHFIFMRPGFMFNPYDSDTWDNLESDHENPSLLQDIPSSQPVFNNYTRQNFPEVEYSDYSSPEVSSPDVVTAPSSPSCCKATLNSFKDVLAARSCYTGGAHRMWVKSHLDGFIALPLSAIGYIRVPKGRHQFNPIVFIYHPLDERMKAQDRSVVPNIVELNDELHK